MSIWSTTAIAVAMAAPSPQVDTKVETIEYTIQAGDSCAKIATERYGDRKHYEVIHEYNRWLGPTLPHHLEEGQVLVLPKTLPPALPDAEVTAARRKVEARPPEQPQWSSARPGLDLYRGWRVNTQERASAEITFRDYSRIEMRENTLVIIYGGARTKARRQTSEATLDRGALRARLGAYTGKTAVSEVKVTTPSAVAELEGGTSLVTVDDTGTSRVANHGTGKARVGSASNKGPKVKVGPKMGSKVVKDERPSKPQPLPPTPAWAGPPVDTFVAAGDSGSIEGLWAPVEAAVSYRVEIARQPDGRELVASQAVSSTVHRFEAHRLPPGDYYVSVAAIDGDAFESPPSDTRKLSLVSVPLLTPGGAPLPELGDDDTATEAPTRVLRGTRLDVPRGLRCGVDGGEPSRQPVLAVAGEHAVDCVDEDDVAVPGFSVTVVEVKVAAAQAEPARRGETTTASFTLDADVPLPRRVWVEAPAGVLVGSPTASETPGTWTVPVHADPGAPDTTSLRVMAEAGGTEVELGQIPLEVKDASRPAETVVAPPKAGPRGPERHIV
ncbi:MAG: FecR domain-containing protein, partial [Nannocystaceae bacterium]